MNDVMFSFVAPAIYKQNYKYCYDSLSIDSNVLFEMIFVGNVPPDDEVGKNFKYIYSIVKPAQCIEIGARESQGQYIIPITDDMKYSYHFLDNLYKEVDNTDMDKYLISFMGFPAGKIGDMDKNIRNFERESHFGVDVGQCGCYSRNLWNKIGGIDRRFIHTLFEVDLHMRCYEIGMSLKLPNNMYTREFFPKVSPGYDAAKEFRENRICHRYRLYSKGLLKSLWMLPDGTASKTRLLPFEPFEDKDIKEITQCEKGEWK